MEKNHRMFYKSILYKISNSTTRGISTPVSKTESSRCTICRTEIYWTWYNYTSCQFLMSDVSFIYQQDTKMISRPIFHVFNLLLWNDVRRELFVPKLSHFLSLKYIQVKQIANLLLLSNIYPVITYSIDEFKKKATNYCVRFGHSLWSAISYFLRWNDVASRELFVRKLHYFLSFKYI